MQYVSKSIGLLITAAFIFFLAGTVPPQISKAQQAEKDTLTEKLNQIEQRLNKADSKLDAAASTIDENKVKTAEILSLLDNVKPAQTQTKIVRVFVKEKAKPEPQQEKAVIDNTKVVQPATIIYQACDYRYGGDARPPFLNFSEWRKQTGKKSSKEYLQYLKDLK